MAMWRSPIRTRFTFALSVKSGEKTDWTRWKIERQGSVPKPADIGPPALAARYALRVEEAAAVGHLAVGEPEAVERGQAVEPVAQSPVPHLELGRRHAHERAGQPGGHLTLDGKALDGGLLLLALEAEAVVGRGDLRECGSHGREHTVYCGLMQGPRLTPTSYIVLGLLEWGGRCTPYDLKGLVKLSVGNFWTLQHAQLYTEPARLAAAGYVTEEREEGGAAPQALRDHGQGPRRPSASGGRLPPASWPSSATTAC